MRWASLLLIPALAWAATDPQVALYESEIWLMRDGHLKPLTHDKRSKGEPVLSPAGTRIAYYEQCFESEHCTPTVVILDLDGSRMMGIQPCGPILNLRWVDNNAVAVECHINPSVSEYIEVELASGRKSRDLFGLAFSISPNARDIAHVGWIMHFAPPYARSEYVQIDRETVYPVRERGKPLPQLNGFASPPEVVKLVGDTYVGIHGIILPIVWSPDSKSVAFVDCTYNWTPKSPSFQSAADGKESQRSCGLAIAGLDRQPERFPIETSNTEKLRIEWRSPHLITFRSGDVVSSITVH